MESKEALKFINNLFVQKNKQVLDELEASLFLEIWEGKAYDDMVITFNNVKQIYSLQHLRATASKLFKKIAEISQIKKVQKKNLKQSIEFLYEEYSAKVTPSKQANVELNNPLQQDELQSTYVPQHNPFMPQNGRVGDQQQVFGPEREIHSVAIAKFCEVPEDVLIQQVREHCRDKILNHYSHIRLLGGKKIKVNQLYVDVWFLDRSLRTRQITYDKMSESFDLRNDRLGLGDRISRDEGRKVANANPKLVILGKPGAGKTTFLKQLAVDWYNEQFQPGLIALFIELREVRDLQWNFLRVITQELGLKDLEQAKVLLLQGKLLLLMDGFDEIATSQLRGQVQIQIQEIVKQYFNNRFILTCRTQIIQKIPDTFTLVEVADFNTEQVEKFVRSWFIVKGNSDIAAQWKTFDNATSKNPALRELTVTPVLLSLMCLVLEDEGGIPSKVVELYERGIKLLLETWNQSKQNDRWKVGSKKYQKLKTDEKEVLLSKIAARKFEHPNNFVLFKQEELVNDITEFLSLTNSEEAVAVLQTIEAQHGLLIERADELWSFSHLTFQEYFTIKWLTQLSYEELAQKIANERWQEVVKNLVKVQQPADRLLVLIKQAIDYSIANDKSLQNYLNWVFQKSTSVEANFKPAVIRAFYFDFNLSYTLALAFDNALDPNHTLARDISGNLAPDLALDLDLKRILNQLYVGARTLDSKLAVRLEQMKVPLPPPSSRSNPEFQNWIEQLRQAMINYRNIGHNWQSINKQQLQRYYNANKFLADLINISGSVSDTTRVDLEDILLPWEELKRRYQQIYWQTQSV